MYRLLPVALFVIPFGLAFGAAASESGMHPTQSIALSILAFSGAAQFAALEFWRDPIAFGSLALLVLALSARHVIMGAALSPWIGRLSFCQQVIAVSLLSDPNFADSQPRFRDGERDMGVLVGGGAVLWLHWVLGTVLGAFSGSRLTEPGLYGIDVVMLCFFAAITTNQFRSKSTWLPASLAAGIAVLTLASVPTGWNIILGAIVGGIAGVFLNAK